MPLDMSFALVKRTIRPAYCILDVLLRSGSVDDVRISIRKANGDYVLRAVSRDAIEEYFIRLVPKES